MDDDDEDNDDENDDEKDDDEDKLKKSWKMKKTLRKMTNPKILTWKSTMRKI